VVVGGIIPRADHARLTEMGVARVYTPEDYDLNAMMDDLVQVIQSHQPAAV
jgi:(2R)-ethylmalonyl-CoA mutase